MERTLSLIQSLAKVEFGELPALGLSWHRHHGACYQTYLSPRSVLSSPKLPAYLFVNCRDAFSHMAPVNWCRVGHSFSLKI